MGAAHLAERVLRPRRAAGGGLARRRGARFLFPFIPRRPVVAASVHKVSADGRYYLDQAQARLDDWLEADRRVSQKQSYSIAGRSLSLADAKEIRENIDYWSRKVETLAAGASGRGRVRYGVSS